MKHSVVPFFAGVLFALGLGVAGMTDPSKVRAFLDVFGAWDASLAVVMVTAIGSHLAVAQWARRASRPLSAPAFHLPDASAKIDTRLIGGAVTFGVGWGLSGFCPGPALVSLVTAARSTVAFAVAMAVGICAARWLEAARVDAAATTAEPQADG